MIPEQNQVAAQMALARKHLLAAIKAHEDEAHNGQVCLTERLNALAWLAHCVGLKATEAPRLMPLIFDLDVKCAGDTCSIHVGGTHDAQT